MTDVDPPDEPRVGHGVLRIEPAASWDDLVLSEERRRLLRELTDQVRQQPTVYERWGFAAKGRRVRGITALFAGPSGTGKTMAAEVVAGELRVDLYRIDLSAVVNKYIGDTEKNLGKIFAAGEAGGAVLLFEEADALLGKRSEVADRHDGYANRELSYLLARMEAYRGLSILTKNREGHLERGTVRRLRFIIDFPLPDREARELIWRRAFPDATPTVELDFEKLAEDFELTGGEVDRIALRAAFLAAGEAESGPVTMEHIRIAARRELRQRGFGTTATLDRGRA